MLIYSGGSCPSVAHHVEVARHVVRRVAEELGHALVLPVLPNPPQSNDRAHRDIMGALAAATFTSVLVTADEGGGSQDTTLDLLANRLGGDLKGKGVNVYSVAAHEMRPGQAMTLNADSARFPQ